MLLRVCVCVCVFAVICVCVCVCLCVVAAMIGLVFGAIDHGYTNVHSRTQTHLIMLWSVLGQIMEQVKSSKCILFKFLLSEWQEISISENK